MLTVHFMWPSITHVRKSSESVVLMRFLCHRLHAKTKQTSVQNAILKWLRVLHADESGENEELWHRGLSRQEGYISRFQNDLSQSPSRHSKAPCAMVSANKTVLLLLTHRSSARTVFSRRRIRSESSSSVTAHDDGICPISRRAASRQSHKNALKYKH